MIAVTHSTISVLLGLIVCSFWGFSIGAFEVLAMITFAWLPDLDSPNSLLGKSFYFLSRRINLLYGHRGFLHSLTFFSLLVVVTAPVCFFFGPKVYVFLLIFWVAYLSHILADCFTLSGVRLLYPSATVYVFPKNELFRFQTGNMKVESVIITVCLFLSVVYFVSVVRSDGLISFLRIKFGQPKMAEDQFSSFEGFKYRADAKIYDKAARSEIIFTDVEVLYADKARLIVRQGETIKDFQEGDYFTLSKVALKKTEDRYDVLKLTNEQLSITKTREGFGVFIGTVKPAVPVQAQGVTGSDGFLKLFYVPFATLKEVSKAVETENGKTQEQIDGSLAETAAFKQQSIRRQIETLSRERDRLVVRLNASPGIVDQQNISSSVGRIDAKLEGLKLDLLTIDASADARIMERVRELRTHLVTNVSCSGILIR